jgi:hypothetical protein
MLPQSHTSYGMLGLYFATESSGSEVSFLFIVVAGGIQLQSSSARR